MEIVFHKEIFFEIFIYGRKVEDLLEKKEKASVKLNFDKIKKGFHDDLSNISVHIKILFKFDLDNIKRVVNLIFIIFPFIRKFPKVDQNQDIAKD